MDTFKKSAGRTFLALLLLALASGGAGAGEFAAGLHAGYNAGVGFQGSGTFLNFTRDVPLSARFTLGYHWTSAGDPYAARRIFINNNTNGSPEKSANLWMMRFDLLFPVFDLGSQKMYFFGGARHGRYTANFNYVGGNENFDVKSNPWGLGLGFETWFAIGETTDFVAQLGVDYFGKSALQGHDTTYMPSGDDVNPREDYTYEDADAAIDQPGWEMLVMIGIRVRL